MGNRGKGVNFPNTVLLFQAREATSAALEAAQAVQAALETPPTITIQELQPQPDPEELQPQPDQDSTIMGRLQPISEPSLKVSKPASVTLGTAIPDTWCCSAYLTRTQHCRVTLTYQCLIAVFTLPEPSTNSCFNMSQHYFCFF